MTWTFGRIGVAAPSVFTDDFERADRTLNDNGWTPAGIYPTGTSTENSTRHLQIVSGRVTLPAIRPPTNREEAPLVGEDGGAQGKQVPTEKSNRNDSRTEEPPHRADTGTTRPDGFVRSGVDRARSPDPSSD